MAETNIKNTGAATPITSGGTLLWGFPFLHVLTVAIVYFVGSTLPALPAVFAQIESGAAGDPELSSLTVALTVMVGMALGLLMSWFWLKREGVVGEAWNLSTPPVSWGRTIGWAAAATLVIFLIFGLGGAAVDALGLGAPDPGFVLDLVTESPAMFAVWIIGVAILAAGAGEELLYRGFLMDRLSRVAGLRDKIWLVIIIQAVLFGLPHAYQGWGGVVVTGTVGLFFGWLRVRMNGNLWACIIAHAAVDVLAMSLAYAEKLGWLSV
ncbi:CPBP family intramembrane glutamic endopeptidase [Aurantiacibacter sp. D1-12]|uniref:CPBP family intramembrane glutamic endopeptidase n=1 Tax=Aurantiacibacter sp. D1-12 TaxID=2993658 RepID=UPI00237D0349|nr:CPBP family intramembrane glutamic endopeptidase [Aurantiacibacter sp. D1-12]MDE1467570.1 CPBP family intramembrane metalloprotease [Aurantiacibacter sp. D1-12]